MEDYSKGYISTHYHPVAQGVATMSYPNSTSNSCSSESDHSYSGPGSAGDQHRYANVTPTLSSYPSMHYHPYHHHQHQSQHQHHQHSQSRAAAAAAAAAAAVGTPTSISAFSSSAETLRAPQNPYPGLSHPPYDFSSHYIPDYLKDTVATPSIVQLEDQDTADETLLVSEKVFPALEGFPDADQFDQVIANYIRDLSVKKQDKALIHAKRARHIRSVLERPKDTTIESAQFRFWAKKMFSLETRGDNMRLHAHPLLTAAINKVQSYICHHGKPVAIREKLFKILTEAHKRCAHGGRDKTSQEIRHTYSWIPKELISRFVKICPTCQVRRGGTDYSPVNRGGIQAPASPSAAHLRAASALLPRVVPDPRARASPLLSHAAASASAFAAVAAANAPRPAGWWSVDSLHAGLYPGLHQHQHDHHDHHQQHHVDAHHHHHSHHHHQPQQPPQQQQHYAHHNHYSAVDVGGLGGGSVSHIAASPGGLNGNAAAVAPSATATPTNGVNIGLASGAPAVGQLDGGTDPSAAAPRPPRGLGRPFALDTGRDVPFLTAAAAAATATAPSPVSATTPRFMRQAYTPYSPGDGAGSLSGV